MTQNVCPNAHPSSKINTELQGNMIKSVLQISETAINESFESTNSFFDQFRLFTSSLFFQIMDEITMIIQNLTK